MHTRDPDGIRTVHKAHVRTHDIAIVTTSARSSTRSFHMWSVWERTWAHCTFPFRCTIKQAYRRWSSLPHHFHIPFRCYVTRCCRQPAIAYSLSGRRRTLDFGCVSSSNSHHKASMSALSSPVLLVCSSAPTKTGDEGSKITHPQAHISPLAALYAPSMYTTAVVRSARAGGRWCLLSPIVLLPVIPYPRQVVNQSQATLNHSGGGVGIYK